MNMIWILAASTAVFDRATCAWEPANDAPQLLPSKPDARGRIAVGGILCSPHFGAGGSHHVCNALQLTGRHVTTVASHLATDSAVGRPCT